MTPVINTIQTMRKLLKMVIALIVANELIVKIVALHLKANK